jgi:hypothetical protein
MMERGSEVTRPAIAVLLAGIAARPHRAITGDFSPANPKAAPFDRFELVNGTLR